MWPSSQNAIKSATSVKDLKAAITGDRTFSLSPLADSHCMYSSTSRPGSSGGYSRPNTLLGDIAQAILLHGKNTSNISLIINVWTIGTHVNIANTAPRIKTIISRSDDEFEDLYISWALTSIQSPDGCPSRLQVRLRAAKPSGSDPIEI
jgi:hypothetical protein